MLRRRMMAALWGLASVMSMMSGPHICVYGQNAVSPSASESSSHSESTSSSSPGYTYEMDPSAVVPDPEPIGLGHHFHMLFAMQTGTVKITQYFDEYSNDSRYLAFSYHNVWGGNMRYSYHLPFFFSLNYFVGTAVEWYGPWKNPSEEMAFAFSYNLPSFWMGLVWNASRAHRVLLSAEYALRVLELSYRPWNAHGPEDELRTVQVMADDVEITLQWMIYVSQRWFVSLVVYLQRLFYSSAPGLQRTGVSSYLDFDFLDQSFGVMMGFGYRL